MVREPKVEKRQGFERIRNDKDTLQEPKSCLAGEPFRPTKKVCTTSWQSRVGAPVGQPPPPKCTRYVPLLLEYRRDCTLQYTRRGKSLPRPTFLRL